MLTLQQRRSPAAAWPPAPPAPPLACFIKHEDSQGEERGEWSDGPQQLQNKDMEQHACTQMDGSGCMSTRMQRAGGAARLRARFATKVPTPVQPGTGAPPGMTPVTAPQRSVLPCQAWPMRER